MRSYGKKPGWFLEKVPSGLLPAVEIDGKLMTESIDIMIALNDIDPTRTPMLPLDDPGMRRAEKLLRLERKLFGAWCQMLFRPPPVLGRQNLSTSVKRLLGMDASSVDGNDDETESPPEALDFLSCLDQVDAELAADVSTPWFFSAEHPSLVDLQFITHVERMLASTLYWKGIVIRGGRWKHINRWLDAFELRPSYMNTKSDYYTHGTSDFHPLRLFVSPFLDNEECKTQTAGGIALLVNVVSSGPRSPGVCGILCCRSADIRVLDKCRQCTLSV